jgi:hypothetical protein
MLRAGVSFPVLMKLLGHVNPEMTMRYVDVVWLPKTPSELKTQKFRDS